MKKKILSLVLVAAMLASMLVFAPTVGASTEAKAAIDITETAGFAGSTVTVDIMVKTGTTLAGYQQLIEYDKTRLELVDTEDELHHTPAPFWFTSQNLDNATYFKGHIANGGFFSLSDAGIGDEADGYEYDDETGYVLAVDFVKVATLTFKIKDNAPAGDAYVASRYVDTNTWVTVRGGVSYALPGEVEYIEGKVTVLDGSAPVTDPADFVIEELDEGTCKIVEYFGDASVLNIPSEINGLTVVEIGSMIFCDVDHTTYRKVLIEGTIDKSSGVYRDGVTENNTITAIIVPATVTTIKDYAFINANVCSSVVLLGEEFEYVAYNAFGYVGAKWNNGTGGAAKTRGTISSYGYPEGDEYTEDEELLIVGNVKLSVVNVEALGEDFLNNGEFVFNTTVLAAANEIAVTIGDATTTYSAFGSAIKAPVLDGVLAWTDAEGNVIAPGADLNGATEITAVTVEAPVSSTEVTAKITDEFAMRFEATVSKATYDAMAELGDVTMGMLITPRQYVVKAKAFTMEALDALVAGTDYKGYVKVDVQNPIRANAATFDECTEFTIAGSLANIKPSTASKNPDFVAIGFLQVNVGGQILTVYGDYNYLAANNIGDFLDNLSTEGLGDTELGWIDAWKSLFNK